MSDHEASFQQFLHFNDADLAANRDGILGPGQRPRLVWSAIWRLLAGPALLIGSLALALAILDAALAAVFALVLVGLGLWLTWVGFAYLVDAIDGRVAFVTAPLVPRVVHGKGTSYYADCGPVSKLISARTYDALPRGLTCHLYYAPGARSLLSIEAASDAEPKPAHPFGPDSAHVWDRLRISWIALTLGALGILIAVHGFIVAHPAHPIPVEGTVASYHETHGRSTYRDLYLQGDPNSYTPFKEGDYSPPAPAFETLTGRNVVLFVNEGTRRVLAIDDGEQLHASDWYLYPEHERTTELALAATAGVVSVVVLAAGAVGIRSRPRTVAGPTPQDAVYTSAPVYAMPALYAPPSVRPWYASWVIVPVLALAGAAAGLLIVLTTHA